MVPGRLPNRESRTLRDEYEGCFAELSLVFMYILQILTGNTGPDITCLSANYGTLNKPHFRRLNELANVRSPSFNDGDHEQLPLKPALVSREAAKCENFFVYMATCEESPIK